MKVFIVNGVSLSGKDTFCNFVRNLICYGKANDPNMTIEQIRHYHGGRVKVISTIDPVKEIYRLFFGWNGEKSDIHRKNLNMLKHIWIQTSNGPSKWLSEQLDNFNNDGDTDIVFVMVREFEEMMNAIVIAKEICGSAETIQLVRHGIPIPPVEQEFLDSHPIDYAYDWTIINPTVDTFPDVPKLQSAACEFLNLTYSREYTCETNPVVWNPIDERFVEWVNK